MYTEGFISLQRKKHLFKYRARLSSGEVTLFPSGKEEKKKIKRKKSHIHRQNAIEEHKVLVVKLLSGQALDQELQQSEHDSLSECRKRPF